MTRIATAFILGAGLGVRLRPLTADTPKPLLPIRGKPMVCHVMDRLADYGVTRFIINTHHAAGRWREAFPHDSHRGIPILFRHEPILLGTAGGLKNIGGLIGDETILLHSGDVVTDLPLAPLVDAHFRRGAEATLALRSRAGFETIGVDGEGAIRRVGPPPAALPSRLTPPAGDALEFYDYANVAVIGPAFLRRIPDAPPDQRGLAAVWREMAARGDALHGLALDGGFWHNVGTPEEYRVLNSAP